MTFLERSRLLPASYVAEMRKGLLSGQGLAQIMGRLGFSDAVVTQLSLAEMHGNIQNSLTKIHRYLTQLLKVRKKLVEVATYPLILLLFLLMIMLGLKNYLLPQLEDNNLATDMVRQFPTLFFVTISFVGLVACFYRLYARRLPPLLLMTHLARLPFFGKFLRLYLTAYYAREWGNLLGQGLELMTVTQLMQEQDNRLFVALGADLEKALLAGQSFHDKIFTYPFFLNELSLIIAYGQVKAKLGRELEVYAKESWEMFFHKLHKAVQLIQPLVFLLVAVVIVMIYVAMLLPIYQNMEVHL